MPPIIQVRDVYKSFSKAGNTVEEPLAYVHELLSTEDLTSTLSDDISSIVVSDGSVAVLLPKTGSSDLEVAQ